MVIFVLFTLPLIFMPLSLSVILFLTTSALFNSIESKQSNVSSLVVVLLVLVEEINFYIKCSLHIH